MRFDYYHFGNAENENFSFDEVVNDGPWAGSLTQNIDNLRLGKYFFEIQDSTRNVLYSQGFASIYGEWETTPEANEQHGVFHESLRFPWQTQAVTLVIYKRNIINEFEPCWEYNIDPKHYRVNKAYAQPPYKTFPIINQGSPNECIDIVVLGEGYTETEMQKFVNDAAYFGKVITESNAYADLKDRININAVFTPSANSGVNHPHQDIAKMSALGVSYGSFDSERYALSYDNKKIRSIAAAVPYDNMAILMNDTIYGGGGIYNLYITAAAGNDFKEYLYVHEFGHHFADLADEYYASATSYEMGSTLIEPWELNVTIQTEKSKIKWGDLIAEDTPLPTPWNKEVFDNNSRKVQETRIKMRQNKVPEYQMTKLFKEQQHFEDSLLRSIEHDNRTGIFEGAQYHEFGVYRSAPNCTMFTRTLEFCPACKRAINEVGKRHLK